MKSNIVPKWIKLIIISVFIPTAIFLALRVVALDLSRNFFNSFISFYGELDSLTGTKLYWYELITLEVFIIVLPIVILMKLFIFIDEKTDLTKRFTAFQPDITSE